MKRIALMTMGIALFGVASSQALYAPGRTIKDQNISVKSWGSGTISETDEFAFEGTHSIRISTRNFFQGGVIRFGTPVKVADAFADSNNLLRVEIRVADATASATGGGRQGGPGFGAGGGGGAVPPPSGGGGRGGGGDDQGGAGRFGGGPPGGGFPGGPPPGFGGPGGATGAAAATPALKTVRYVVTTTDGLKSEAYVPVSTGGADARGWRPVAIPLKAIRGFERTNKEIESVSISGDATTTFYVGSIRVVSDSTPVQGRLLVQSAQRGWIEPTDLNLGLGDEITFGATGSAGASVLKFSWDFDSSDGIQEDAVGDFVKRRFRKPGTFTITLTVVDEFGLKAPFTRTIQVKVNP